MTITPEQRADGVVHQACAESPKNDWAGFLDVLTPIIAAAIREAEDAALERAAEVCDDDQGLWDDVVIDGEYDSIWRAGKSLSDAAAEIRSLKHPKD